MKARLINSFFTIAVIITLLGSFSCRKQNINKSSADSTATRVEQKSEKWASETVTEVLLDPEDFKLASGLDLGFELPAIFGLTAKDTDSLLSAIGFKKAAADQALAGLSGTKARKGKVIYRRIEKASGTVKQEKQETKQVRTQEVDKTKKPSAAGSWLIGISLAAIALLICLIIIYRSKKRY